MQRSGKQRRALGEGQLVKKGLEPTRPAGAFEAQAIGLLEQDPNLLSHVATLGDQHHAVDGLAVRNATTITGMAAARVRKRRSVHIPLSSGRRKSFESRTCVKNRHAGHPRGSTQPGKRLVVRIEVAL